MKKFVLPILVLVLLFTAIAVDYEPVNYLLNISAILLGLLFIFNNVMQKKLSFKNYYVNKNNPFTTSICEEYYYEISKDILFEKMKEVVLNSKFKFIKADKDNFEILVQTRMTMKSWGENIYIYFEDVDNKTKVVICSATISQIYDWGNNRKNINYLKEEIEKSLVI